MPRNILAVSPDPDLLENIQLSLQESGNYHVRCVQGSVEALNAAGEELFDAAILDAEMTDIPFIHFTRNLVADHPNLKVLIFPPFNNPHHPAIKGLVTNGYLNKPLFIPGLKQCLAEQFVDLPDLESRTVSLTGEEPGTDDWAWVNNILPMDNSENPIEDEVTVNEDEILGEAELKKLDELLTNLPPPDPEDEVEEPPPLAVMPELSAWITESNTLEITTPPPLPENGSMDALQQSTGKAVDNLQKEVVTVENLINEQSSSRSGVDDLGGEELTGSLPWENQYQVQEDSLGNPPPFPPLPSTPVELFLESEPDFNDGKNKENLDSEFQVETAPGTEPLGIKGLRLEYYCILVPRIKEQFLTREISARLSFILPQIHLAQGWRVTGINVRPTHLMWRILLPAACYPRDAVEFVRGQVNTHFYTNFPELMVQNTDFDFWAPGYLVLSGDQAPQDSLLQLFIQRSRSTASAPDA